MKKRIEAWVPPECVHGYSEWVFCPSCTARVAGDARDFANALAAAQAEIRRLRPVVMAAVRFAAAADGWATDKTAGAGARADRLEVALCNAVARLKTGDSKSKPRRSR